MVVEKIKCKGQNTFRIKDEAEAFNELNDIFLAQLLI